MQALEILIVDDNRSAADALARLLELEGDHVTPLYDGQSACDFVRTNRPDVVLTDLRMTPVDGMEVLRTARELEPPIEVIVFTAFGAVNVAVEAMRLGARDFLTKPVTVDQIRDRLLPLRDGDLTSPADDPDFVAVAAQSVAMRDALKRAADVPSPVWLTGEVGCGRGFAARYLHRMGRPEDPYLEVNPSKSFDWPDGGTVLIPNVDHLSLAVQEQLTRELGNRPPDTRVVASSGPDPRRMVVEGKLHPDLYYSLSVITIEVEPLRARIADVVPLFEAAVKAFATRYRREIPEIDQALISRLEQHSWPGNVRELRNLAERTVVMGPETTQLSVQPTQQSGIPTLEPGFSLSDYLENVERAILSAALKQTDGDRNAAGRLLGVERNTLRYKLNKYGLLDR